MRFGISKPQIRDGRVCWGPKSASETTIPFCLFRSTTPLLTLDMQRRAANQGDEGHYRCSNLELLNIQHMQKSKEHDEALPSSTAHVILCLLQPENRC